MVTLLVLLYTAEAHLLPLSICPRSFKTDENMELAIRVNVRYVAPPNSKIQDALQLFRSPSWVQFIIRYIMPQLNNASPASTAMLNNLDKLVSTEARGEQCVICMDRIKAKGVKLPCGHGFHRGCVLPWLKLHSTCPTCRHQLPTDAGSIYSVHAINTTIVLQQSQANIPTEELMNLPAGNQTIQAVVNARVRRNSSGQNTAVAAAPEMDSSVMQSSSEGPAAAAVALPRRSTRRRRRSLRRSRDESALDSSNMVVSAVDSRQPKRARTYNKRRSVSTC